LVPQTSAVDKLANGTQAMYAMPPHDRIGKVQLPGDLKTGDNAKTLAVSTSAALK
jgi:hypothetical protein